MATVEQNEKQNALQEALRRREEQASTWEAVRLACRAEDFDKARAIADSVSDGILKNDLIHFIRFTSENFCLPRKYWDNSVK